MVAAHRFAKAPACSVEQRACLAQSANSELTLLHGCPARCVNGGLVPAALDGVDSAAGAVSGQAAPWGRLIVALWVGCLSSVRAVVSVCCACVDARGGRGVAEEGAKGRVNMLVCVYTGNTWYYMLMFTPTQHSNALSIPSRFRLNL